jgi:hypothetical protein
LKYLLTAAWAFSPIVFSAASLKNGRASMVSPALIRRSSLLIKYYEMIKEDNDIGSAL